MDPTNSPRSAREKSLSTLDTSRPDPGCRPQLQQRTRAVRAHACSRRFWDPGGLPRRSEQLCWHLRRSTESPRQLRRVRRGLPSWNHVLAGRLCLPSWLQRLRRGLRRPCFGCIELRYLRQRLRSRTNVQRLGLQLHDGDGLHDGLRGSAHEPQQLRGLRRGVPGDAGLYSRQLPVSGWLHRMRRCLCLADDGSQQLWSLWHGVRGHRGLFPGHVHDHVCGGRNEL